jgi:hypothetical protein
MRRWSGILVALSAASAALLMAACGAGESPGPSSGDTARANSWQAVPAGPLGPREGALGLWTGHEVLLIGGSDAPPCLPNASCVPPEAPPLADGAAFDPLTREWRRMADSPVPFEWAQGLVVGTTAYVWIPGSPARPRVPSDSTSSLPPHNRRPCAIHRCVGDLPPEAESAFVAYRIEEDR